MKFYEYGDKDKPVVLFFHAAITNPAMYKNSIELLKEKYYIIAPEASAHTLGEKADFTSVAENVRRTEEYLFDKNIKKLHGLYGVSMGGAFALKFLADNKIKVDKTIIDAGISPYEFCKNTFINYLLTRGALLSDTVMLLFLRCAEKYIKKSSVRKFYSEETLNSVFDLIRSMPFKSLVKTFEETNNYQMPDKISVNKENIQYWYGSLEKKDRKADIKFVKKVVPGITLKEFDGYQHAELILEHSREAVQQITSFFEE